MVDIAGSLKAASRQYAEGCCKIREDLARYRKVIAETGPDGTLEIGTFSGKSALWFARETGGPVFTVDVGPQVDEATAAEFGPARVTLHRGRSTDPVTVRAAGDWVSGHNLRAPLVVLDGDHSAPTVLAELHAYAGLVPVGGYVVVEDTLVRFMPSQRRPLGPYDGSPWDAVETFLVQRPGDWRVDVDLDEEHDGVGQYPNGWLRRVR